MDTTSTIHERLVAECGEEYATAVRAAAAVMVASNALRFHADANNESVNTLEGAQRIAYQEILMAPLVPPLAIIPDHVEQYAWSIAHGLLRENPLTWA